MLSIPAKRLKPLKKLLSMTEPKRKALIMLPKSLDFLRRRLLRLCRSEAVNGILNFRKKMRQELPEQKIFIIFPKRIILIFLTIPKWEWKLPTRKAKRNIRVTRNMRCRTLRSSITVPRNLQKDFMNRLTVSNIPELTLKAKPLMTL